MKKGEDDREKKPEKSVKQKISLANPCITAEKFFFDNKTDQFVGENGLGYIATHARNFLSKDAFKNNFMVAKTPPQNHQDKSPNLKIPLLLCNIFELKDGLVMKDNMYPFNPHNNSMNQL